MLQAHSLEQSDQVIEIESTRKLAAASSKTMSMALLTLLGGITEKMKVRENSFFDMESLVGIIMSVCAKF